MFIILYVTHPSEEEAKRISDALVAQKHIACANIFPMQSAYWWKGAVEQEGEWVSILKTTPEKHSEVEQLIEQLHPYEVPCIMKLEASANAAYEAWIRASVS